MSHKSKIPLEGILELVQICPVLQCPHGVFYVGEHALGVEHVVLDALPDAVAFLHLLEQLGVGRV